MARQLLSLVEDELLSDGDGSHLHLRIAEIARDLFQADFAVLFARDPTTGRFDPSPVVSGPLSRTERAQLTPPRPAGVSQGLVASRLVFVDDLSDPAAEGYRGAFTDAAGVRSFAAAAMPATGTQEPLCILYLDYRAPHAFSDEEKAILRAYADQAALVLRSRLSFEGLRRVRETGELLTQVLDSDNVLDVTVTAIRDAAAADLVVLYPYDADAGTLLRPVSAGELRHPEQPPRADGGISIPSRVLESGDARLLPDASQIYAALGMPADGNPLPFLEREEIRSMAALPLLVGNERVGVLFVNYRRRQEMDPPQAEVVQGLSSYAAIAIRNSGVLRGLRDKEVRRLELLRSIDREIIGTLQLDRVLQATLTWSAREVGAEEASILLYDEQKNLLDTVAAVGPHAEASLKQRILLSDLPGITKWVFDNRVPKRLGDVPNDPEFGPLQVASAPGIVSELDVPLLYENGVLGVMNYESRRRDAFTQADEDFLVTLADHAVLAIHNARAYAREQRTARERSIMAEVSRRIAARASLDEVYELILDTALELTGATAGEVMLVRPELGLLERVAGGGGVPERRVQLLGTGIIGWVVANDCPFHEDILVEPWQSLYIPELPDTQSEMAVPLRSGGQVIGVLDVESPEPQRFSRHDLGLLEALTDLASVAIHNADSEHRAGVQLTRFQVLHRAGQELGSIAGLDDGVEQAYEAIVRIAHQHTQAEVVVRRYEPATRELVARLWAHVQARPPHPSIKVDDRSLNAQVFRERRSFVVHDTEHPPPEVDAIDPSDPRTRTLLVTPVQARETYYGNLALSHHEPYHFLETDLELFEGLAHLLALTLHRLEMTAALGEAEFRARVAEDTTAMNSGAAELAHRLGNDMGKVPWHVARIRKLLKPVEPLDSRVHESLDTIKRKSDVVLALSTALAELKEQFSDGGEHPIDIPLRPLLQELGNWMPSRPDGIELVVDDAPHDGVMLHVIPNQVVRIMTELVRNAVDALGEEGRIEVRAEVGDEHVRLHCIDTGAPIPPANRKRIFLPFYTTKEKGTGMGLWLQRANAVAAGGSLELRSSARGNTFTLQLPRVFVPDPPARQG